MITKRRQLHVIHEHTSTERSHIIADVKSSCVLLALNELKMNSEHNMVEAVNAVYVCTTHVQMSRCIELDECQC